MVVPLIVPAPGHLKAVLINNGAIKTNNPQVDLILSAANATHMMISNNSSFTGAVWEVYVTAKQWLVSDTQVGPGFGDESKTVYAKFGQGSIAPPAPPVSVSSTQSAIIILDTSPPIVGPVPIMINGGALKTNTKQVMLMLNATGAEMIQLYNDVDLFATTGGTILPYSPTVNWVLSEGNGIKTVYVVFIDDIANRTSFFSADITLIGQQAGEPAITEPIDGAFTADPFIDIRGSGDPGAIIRIHDGE